MRPFPLFRIRSGLATLCVALACLGATGPVQAQAGGTGAAASAGRNVYAAGGQVRPTEAVVGDYGAMGGRVILDQPVGGDASLAGGAVDVRAPVGDDLRAAGGDINIESTVGGELLATGGNVTVLPAATVGRGATLYGGSVRMEGRVDGELRVAARSITIDGEVRGNARLAAEQIELGPRARILGNLNYSAPAALKKAEGATVGGTVTREEDALGQRAPPEARQWGGSIRGPAWAGGVVSFLALLACTAIFLLLVPRFGGQAAGHIQSSPWLSLGLGFGTVVALPVLAVLLFITLLGIPLGLAVMALYPALLLAGFVVGVLFIARLLALALRRQVPAGFASSLAYAAAALLLTLAATLVPFVGALFAASLSLAGVGACVLEMYHRRKGPHGPAVNERPVVGVPAEAH